MVFTLSATAPQFLPEQEQQEWATLSQEELESIEEDLHGSLRVEETLMNDRGVTGLDALEETISKMTVAEKRAYSEACEKAPLLVKAESDPLWFLRCEKYNAEVGCKSSFEHKLH